jgi:pimeloyl-ACP methyl ester carboxylesterase
VSREHVLESRAVELGGRTVRWQVAGGGPPLVCVHGLAASSRWWWPVLPPLAERFEVHLVDLPRFSALRGFRPGDAAGWLLRWLEASGLVRPTLVGHSLGGLLSAQVATRTELDRLVLVAPAGLPTGRSFAREALALAASGLATPGFMRRVVTDGLRCGPENVLRGGLYARRVDLTLDLRRVRVPTLVVWGTRDALAPFRLAEAWCGAIPDARLAVLEDVGHIAMVQAPQAFLDAVLSFV